MQGKVEPDDSEAETDILSTSNTPVKGRKFGHEDAPEGISETSNMGKGRSSPTHQDSSSHSAGDTISVRRKRKVPVNEASEANGSPIWSANDDANEEQPVVHAKTEPRSRSHSRSHSRSTSSKKVTRPVRKIHMNSRSSDVAGMSNMSAEHSPDASAFLRSQSPHTHFAPAHNKHLKSTKESSSTRAATQEPRSASRSLSPPARRLHKRSSSFHSAVTPAPRERRPKTRHSDTLASQSTNARSPSAAADTFTADHLTPSHSANMSGRTDRTGRTALARACEKREVATVKSILADSKEDLNVPDNALNRPIQFAALQGSIEIVKILIDAQCEVDVVNSDGDSPLIDAIARGHVEIVEMLLDHNVDPNRTNKKGEAPEDYIRDDEEHKDRILELLKDARSKYISPKHEDKGRERPTVALDSLHAGRSSRKQHIRNDLLYVDFSYQRLHDYSQSGDLEGVEHMERGGIKADNRCAVAAAGRGHAEVLETLFFRFQLPCDPDPENTGGETPMLAAIARGHLNIIRCLLNHDEFDLSRKFRGKTYSQIAADQKGPRYLEVVNMLKEASGRNALEAEQDDAELSEPEAPPKKRKRLISKKEMTASSNASHHDTMESRSVDTSVLSDDDQSISLLASPSPAPVPASPVRPTTPPEVRERREREIRQAYLDTLPRAVARALTPEGRIRGRINYVDAKPEVEYLKDLEDWMPIPVRHRIDIEPDCQQDVAYDLYIPNVFVPVFLRHDRMDTCKTAYAWETLPISPKMRETMWYTHGLFVTLIQDHNWNHAPPALGDACGLPIQRFIAPGNQPGVIVTWQYAAEEGYKRWKELPDDQCFWVKMQDFVAQTTPDKAPFLENLTLRFDGRFAKRAPNVMYCRNGAMVQFPAGLPLRDKLKRCVEIG